MQLGQGVVPADALAIDEHLGQGVAASKLLQGLRSPSLSSSRTSRGMAKVHPVSSFQDRH
jgi:hypothetical protein